jgi:hypothetical protein
MNIKCVELLTPLEKVILAHLLIIQREEINENYKLDIYLIVKVIKLLGSTLLENLVKHNRLECWLYKNKYKTNNINFYIKGKKIALHRILYINFIDELDKNIYLKHSCNNNNCYNIYHLEKANLNDIKEANTNIIGLSVKNNNEKIIINLND